MEGSRVIDLCLIMLTYVVSFTNDKKKLCVGLRVKVVLTLEP